MRARFTVLLVVVVAVAAACGNSDSSDESAGDETTSTQAEADDTGASDEITGDGVETDETTGEAADDSGDEADYSEFVSFDETGVTDEAIRVASITSTTNELGGAYGDLNQGIKLYFDQVNEQGGIWGRQLELVSERDDAIVNNLSEAEALVSEDNAYAAFIASLLFTGADVLAAEGIPTFGWNINAEWAGPQNFFPNEGALCNGCAGRGLPWLANELGITKVAVAGYGVNDASTRCAAGIRESFETYGDGAEVVFFDDALSFGQTDFSAQVSGMKDAGAELIATCMDRNGVFGLAREMQIQDYDPIFYHPNLYDAEFVRENAEFFNGDFVTARFTALEHEPQVAGVAEFVEALGDDSYTETTIHGWIAAKQFVDALRATGPEFTREKLVETWNSQEPYTADGFLIPIDWSIQHEDPIANPDKESPLSCTNYVEVVDGEFVSRFTDGEKQWVCFDTRSADPDEPQTMSFAP